MGACVLRCMAKRFVFMSPVSFMSLWGGLPFVSRSTNDCVCISSLAVNPNWKPYPTHSWPFSNTPAANKANAQATAVTNNDNPQIAALQKQLVAQNC